MKNKKHFSSSDKCSLMLDPAELLQFLQDRKSGFQPLLLCTIIMQEEGPGLIRGGALSELKKIHPLSVKPDYPVVPLKYYYSYYFYNTRFLKKINDEFCIDTILLKICDSHGELLNVEYCWHIQVCFSRCCQSCLNVGDRLSGEGFILILSFLFVAYHFGRIVSVFLHQEK